MILPKELTTVTPLSKTIALILFVLLPIIAFLLGMKYQQAITSVNTNMNLPVNNSSPTSQLNNNSIVPSSPTSQQTTSNEAKTLTDIPSLYPNLTWHKITPETFSSGSTWLQILNENYFQSDIKSIPLNKGEEWESDLTGISEQKQSLINDFQSYYDKNMSLLGWDQKVQVGDRYLIAPAGNGSSGNIRGFIAVKDGGLRVLAASSYVKDNKGEGWNAYSQCPCSITYNVYLGDIIPLSKISL